MSEEVMKKEVGVLEDGRVYELGYILVPALSEDESVAMAGTLRDEMEKAGGVYISSELPKHMELAYPMVKPIANKKQSFTEGYFGWMKFEIDPAVAEKMNKAFIRDDRMVRHLMIKTVRENTVIGKRMVTRGEGARKKYTKKDDEPAVEINKEEVDKKLDELLATE